MRSSIAVVAVAATFIAQPVFAEKAISQKPGEKTALFAEEGIYIPPGESREVLMAGECRLLTNTDARMGWYFTLSLHKAWPSELERDPLEPVVTEAPCR